MNTGQTDNMIAVMGELQRRWGWRVLQPARHLRADHRVRPTGIPALDGLLGGGLLPGKATGFTGQPTSGVTTLAFRYIAHSHQAGAEAVYICLPGTFNGSYAAACGVDLDRLLLARPPDVTAAFALTRDILSSQVVELVVLDLGRSSAGRGLHRLHSVLVAAPTALLLLAESPLPDAHTRVRLRCVDWLRDGADITGCRVEAYLERHPLVPAGRSACFDLHFGAPHA